jgi:hypothetical protein
MSNVRFYNQAQPKLELEIIEHIRTCDLSLTIRRIRERAERGEDWQTFFDGSCPNSNQAMYLAITMYMQEQQNKHESKAIDWEFIRQKLTEYADNVREELVKEFGAKELKKCYWRP